MPAIAPPAAPPPAAAAAAARRAAEAPTEVSVVVVNAPPRDPPVVATSFPAQGAAVAPGTMVVRIGFSLPMAPQRWSFGPAPGEPYPRCLDRPRLLADQRTFVLLCVTAGKGPWTLRLNPPTGGSAGAGGGFAALGGKPLATYDLSFTTTDERPVGSLEDAMKAASLADDQGPIMDDRARGPSAPAPAAPPGG